MPILYHRYFLNNFDLRIFSAYNENLIKEVNWDTNPIEGHYFERSWYYIFN